MNLETITESVQRQFGDSTGAQITDDDVVRWVNEGQLEISRATESGYATPATINTVVGTSAYDLPADFFKVSSVSIDGTLLTRTTKQEYNDWNRTTLSNSRPCRYYVQGTKITLMPPPEAVKVLVVDYISRPVAIKAGDSTLSIPELFHQSLLTFCLAKAYQLDGNTNGYAAAMAEFNQRLGNDRDDARYPVDDTYPMIRSSPDDY